MKQLRVCIAGVTGWIGRPLAEAIAELDDLDLVAAIARQAAGTRVGEVTISGSVAEAIQTPFDVFVDYTSADSVKPNVLAAIAARRHVVVGSSGLSDDDYAEIDRSARKQGVGVVAVGNFAISAALLLRFAAEAAKFMPPWAIIDIAHDSNVAPPNGTAREVAWRLSQIGRPRFAVPIEDTVGMAETRGAEVSGSRIHSLRLPGHVISVEVLFGREDERLSIRYEGGTGAAPYIGGTLLAIRRVGEFKGVVRGMAKLL